MYTCAAKDSQQHNMQRNMLHLWNDENQGGETIDTTPLRRSTVRFPRMRLVDKDFQTADVPKPTDSKLQSTASKGTSLTVKIPPLRVSDQAFLEDRFIKYKFSVEAAHYLLTKKPQKSLKRNRLDVFKQVDALSVKWRKKFMHQLMVQENVIPGLRQKQVLRGSHLSLENKLPGSLAGQSKELWDEEYFENGMWKSKPRKRPLIGIMDSILDMPGFRAVPRRDRTQLIDWSSTNMIAAVIQNLVTFYDTRGSSTAESLENVEINHICALKWNNAGDKVALCNLHSDIQLYCVQKQKILWSAKCHCVSKYNFACVSRFICWSQDDQHIVTGCDGLISVYSAYSGRIVKTRIAHTMTILALSFSPNYRYLASSAYDMNIRIFLWPDLSPYLDISYYEPIEALAWHPHESGLLCIGGGLGDASLSLWNVNKLNPVSYRHVRFHGIVENLAWNKHSAELVAQWSYWQGRNRYVVMPVLASLDRIVDVFPLDRETRVNSIMWNPDQTQLAIQYEESLSMWNFFGNEYQLRQKSRKPRKVLEAQSDPKFMTFKEFNHFTIR